MLKRNQGKVVALWKYQSKMNNTALKEMQDYWEELRAGRLVPLRSEVDPREFSNSLESGFVLERQQPGMVRFRLAGMHLSDLMGMEVRGMPLRSFIKPDGRAEFSAEIERVFDMPEMQEHYMVSDQPNSTTLSARLLLLPMRSDKGPIDRALGCLVTNGYVGVSPRRFRVLESVRVSLTDGTTTQTIKPLEVAGFAESQSQFQGQPPSFRPDGRPNLRLVKSDLSE